MHRHNIPLQHFLYSEWRPPWSGCDPNNCTATLVRFLLLPGESLPYPEPKHDKVPTDQYRWLTIEQVGLWLGHERPAFVA